MALSGLSSLEREAYVCKDDPSYVEGDIEASIANGASVFWMRNIPHNQLMVITDNASANQVSLADGGVQTFIQKNAQKARECFRKGISGIDNFTDKEGNPFVAEFQQAMEGGRPIQVLSDECMRMIPGAILKEVGDAVYNKNQLTEPQRKKFEQLSSLFGGSGTSTAENAPTSKEPTEDATEEQEEDRSGLTLSTSAPKKKPKK